MADSSACTLCPFFLPVNPALAEEQPSRIPERCHRRGDNYRKKIHQRRDATAAIRTEQAEPVTEGIALRPAESVVELHAVRAFHVLPHGRSFITPNAEVDSLWKALSENDLIENQRWKNDPESVAQVLPGGGFGPVPSAFGADEVIVIVHGLTHRRQSPEGAKSAGLSGDGDPFNALSYT